VTSRVLGRATVLATAALLVLGVSAVWADDISNNLDASIDAVAEVMALNAGGPNGTTNLYVQPTNGDGKNGCNLTGSTTLVVAVTSSDPGAATVSPTSVTFTSCGDTPTLTITPVGPGSTTVSVSQTSNSTDGTFNLAPATFTVNVAAPTNSAPSVTVDGVTGAAEYEIGSVPVATCEVTDAEDGSSSFPATLSAISGPLSAYGLGEQTASCSYTDDGGLTAAASVTYSIVDATNPVITFVSRTAANGNGWNNADVIVTWSCTDSGSGVVAASVSQTVSAEGANQSAIGTCTDHAGNTASDTQTGINIDKTAPTASASAAPAANGNGWNNTDVTVSFSGSDGLSGIDACAPDVTLSSEGAGQSASGTCTDKAGNTSAPATASGINIDKTAPSVSLVGGPVDGASYYFGAVPAAPTCSASDGLSGLDGTCSVTGYSSAVGAHTVSASVSDKAGNSATASAGYTVLAWTLSGFYQPVDMTLLNTIKGGSTVPLKFNVFAGSTELTSTAVVKSFTAAPITCSAVGTVGEDAIEVTSTGGTVLRYDATGGQFIQNWQTPKGAGICYRTTMTTLDGSKLVAFFKTK
jgi:hypothetical protein